MHENNGMSAWEKVGFFMSAFALVMAIITAYDLAKTSKTCVLRPR
jgi:hypothetical protein